MCVSACVCVRVCVYVLRVRAEGVPTSNLLGPLGTALEMRTGGSDTAVVCLLLDCCNTGTPFVLSGLETVFVGCVTCCFVA